MLPIDFVPFVWFLLKDKRRPILGKIEGIKFRLSKRPRFRNSFAPIFYGEFVAEGDGGWTRIEGRFSMHPAVKAFLAVWFGLLTLMGGRFIVGAIKGIAYGTGSAREGAQVVLLMLFAGVALVLVGKLVGRSEEAYIVDFIKRTLDATPVRYD